MILAEKLERLAVDIRSIADGTGPTADELAQAPVLLNWQKVRVAETALQGLVLDHPKIGTGAITTSLVFWFNPDEGWVRTLSRYYRLG